MAYTAKCAFPCHGVPWGWMPFLLVSRLPSGLTPNRPSAAAGKQSTGMSRAKSLRKAGSQAIAPSGSADSLKCARKLCSGIDGIYSAAVYIAELTYPGLRVVAADRDKAFQIGNLASHLGTSLSEAAICLNLFENAQQAVIEHFEQRRRDLRAEIDPEYDLTLEIKTQLLAAIPAGLPYPEYRAAEEKADGQARVQARRRLWASGVTPTQYVNALPLIHARSFVFALDNIHNAMRVIAMLASDPNVTSVYEEWKSEFPEVPKLRNSAHHYEDRIRGVKRGERQIDLQPVHSQAIEAPDGAVIVDALSGNVLSITGEDGNLASVAVSVDRLAVATVLVQKFLDQLSWDGRSITHHPC